MAPPKFKDLHKKNDDALSKDFHVDCLNHKVSTKYNMAEMGSGSCTYKLDYNTAASANSGEFEIKHTYGSQFPAFLQGVTKTFTMPNLGKCKFAKVKLEKNCAASNSKMTVNMNQDLDKGFFAYSKPSLAFDNNGKKHSVQLNVVPCADFKGMDNVNLNGVYAAGNVNVGALVSYGFAKGAINHHFKLNSNKNGLDWTLGLKDANLIEAVISKNLSKNLNLKLWSMDVTNLHKNVNYDLAKKDWSANIAFETENIQACGFSGFAGKHKINLKTLDYADRMSMKVNDNLTVGFGCKSKLDADFFNNMRIGAALNFSL